MLVISRKANETITIEPQSGLAPGETLQQAFLPAAIEFRLIGISGGKVRLAIAEGGGSDPNRSGHRGSS